MTEQKRFNYLIISALVILVDQITKLLVRKYMLHQSIPVIGDFFRLTHVENPGIAFGLGFESNAFNRIFFSIITFFVIFVILILLKKSNSHIEKIAFSLILGGGLGNLIDRIAFGSITDFFDVYFFNIFGLERWPIFNIADSASVVAIFILLIYVFFFEPRQSKKQHIV